MSTTSYLSFLLLATLLVLIPGADSAVVVASTVGGGRAAGWATSVGICCSNVIQGIAAAAGLGLLIVRSQPAFQAIKWAGVGYLTYLGVRALVSAWRGADPVAGEPEVRLRRAWSRGFLSNITNPKVLVFYLSVLPQFLTADAGIGSLTLLALTHAVIGLGWLAVLVTGTNRLRGWLLRRRVRRWLDGLTGAALLGFAARTAVQR